MQDRVSEPNIVGGAIRGIVVGGILGAIIGGVEGALISGLGVGVGIATGVVAGAVPGGVVGALLTTRIHRDLVRAFPSLTEEEAVGASSHLGRMTAQPGETLVRQGDLAEQVYVVSRGEVEVIRSEAGVESRVAVLGPGEFFGEIGVMRETPRTATVRASKPTEVLKLDSAAFKRFVGTSSGRPELEKTVDKRLGDLERTRQAPQGQEPAS
ncbi:MAG: cyclic nucleotide-binding domain-containing protein [Candidatus Dormibacter sp.]